MKSDLGDRIKKYERGSSGPTVSDGTSPVLIRLDGRGFSRFTADLEEPFDLDFLDLMAETTRHLMGHFNAMVGYTQSDEITLLIHPERVMFGGRIQKIASVSAAMASSWFKGRLPDYLPKKVNEYPHFDSRVFTVPNFTEAANSILWRVQDAEKNSVQKLSRYYMHHKLMMHKSCEELKEVLLSKFGVSWENYPDDVRHGVMLRRALSICRLTPDVIGSLPPKHEALTSGKTYFVRTKIERLDRSFSEVSDRTKYIEEAHF